MSHNSQYFGAGTCDRRCSNMSPEREVKPAMRIISNIAPSPGKTNKPPIISTDTTNPLLGANKV